MPRNDFEWNVWQPARAVLDGGDPYPDTASLDVSRGRWAIKRSTTYPPPGFLAALPLAALPAGAATVVIQLLLAAAAFMTLWVLGVRDWRCHALWLTSVLVVHTVVAANIHMFVVLCAALLWRYRDTAWAAAVALSVAIVLKLLLVPLWFWLVFTDDSARPPIPPLSFRAFSFSSWSLIGFNGLVEYHDLLSVLRDRYESVGAFAYGLAHQTGAGAVASVGGTVAALLLLAVAWRFRRNEVAAFALAIGAALVRVTRSPGLARWCAGGPPGGCFAPGTHTLG